MKEQNLTLVGLTEDKQHLVLVSDAGDEFVLPADARLRAALRGDHARLGQLEITMESALRPRDIQARIRAGESPEDVASAAQTTIDKVMGYATPVLAERAHVAERALRASVRRKGADGPSRLLGDAVAERLRGRNVAPDSVQWDAWRREDGRWTLVADYRSGESVRHAEFLFDAPGRYVVAEDDEARWLVGEPSSSKGPRPRTSAGGRRLASVSNDDELPLGADVIGLVNVADPASPDRAPDRPTADRPTADRPDADRPEPADHPAAAGDADWIATQASERPEPVQQAASGSTPEDDRSGDSVPADPEPRRAAKRTRGRASVPSWDEIMFGGGKQE